MMTWGFNHFIWNWRNASQGYIRTLRNSKSTVSWDVIPLSWPSPVSILFGHLFRDLFWKTFPMCESFSLLFCLAYSFNLKMEAVHSSGISVNFYKIARRHITDDSTHQCGAVWILSSLVCIQTRGNSQAIWTLVHYVQTKCNQFTPCLCGLFCFATDVH